MSMSMRQAAGAPSLAFEHVMNRGSQEWQGGLQGKTLRKGTVKQ